MTRRLGFIVTDASPLITLAAAQALDCLTMPGVPIFVPDMVYAEVTFDLARLGAEDVVEWVRGHAPQVTITPTHVFAEFEALRGINPSTRSQGRGEQAALEILNAGVTADRAVNAVLLFEDGDIQSRSFLRLLPPQVFAISTGDSLRELEAAGRIQSSDRILDMAAARGRQVEKQRGPSADHGPRSLLREHRTSGTESGDPGRGRDEPSC